MVTNQEPCGQVEGIYKLSASSASRAHNVIWITPGCIAHKQNAMKHNLLSFSLTFVIEKVRVTDLERKMSTTSIYSEVGEPRAPLPSKQQ